MYGLSQRTVGATCRMAPPRLWGRPRGDDDEHMNGVVDVEHEDDRRRPATPGTPHKVSVKGTERVTVNVAVKTYRGKVWLCWPPLTWEAIMDSAKVDELVHVLELAREEAKKEGSG